MTKYIILLILTWFNSAYSQQRIGNRIVFSQSEAIDYYYTSEGEEYLSPEDYPKQYTAINTNQIKLYNVYKLALEDKMVDFPAPPIVMLNKEQTAASRLEFADGEGVSTNVIFISEETANSSHLLETLAHEMAHYFLDHGKRNTQEKEISGTWLSENNSNDCISCTTHWEENLVVDDEIREILGLINHLGSLYNYDTDGVPLNILEDGGLLDQAIALMLQTSSEDESCYDALDSYNNIIDYLNQNCSIPSFNTCTSNDEFNDQLKSLSAKFRSQASICFEGSEDIFANSMEEVYSFPFSHYIDLKNQNSKKFLKELDKLKKDLSLRQSQFLDIALSNINPFERIIRISHLYQEELSGVLSKLNTNISNIRFNTKEDEADILSQLVLKNTGIKNRSTEYYLDHMDENDRQACLDLVKNNREIPYGFLTDHHHSLCWRYWRARKLDQEIKSQPDKDKLIQTILSLNYN